MDKKRILVVDDARTITALLKSKLEATGRYEVREENAGSKVVAVAREFHPDLVLLDIMMPDADGGDVAAAFRADPLLRAIPIVFLTAAVTREEVATKGGGAMTIRGRVFLAKPVNIDEVLTCLERQLATSR